MNKFRTTVSLLNAKREQTRLVLSEETFHGIGARHSVSTKILKTVVTGDRCIHVICTGGHKITSLETKPITSCAKTPGGKPCSEGTVCNYLCEEVCNGYVNNQNDKGSSGANPRLMHEVPFRALNLGCVMSVMWQIITSIFLLDTEDPKGILDKPAHNILKL